jgi:diaminohydroxyphosphoribosylaminopyrimidine deaminase/5-amino-6-(5-phosphoribosylamino)uracil reductase
MGLRDLPAGKRVFNDRAETLRLRTRDPHEALAELFARDRQHVFLEGGPTLAAAFLADGLVDRLLVFVAPVIAGDGPPMTGPLPAPLDLGEPELERVGADVLLSWRPREA